MLMNAQTFEVGICLRLGCISCSEMARAILTWRCTAILEVMGRLAHPGPSALCQLRYAYP